MVFTNWFDRYKRIFLQSYLGMSIVVVLFPPCNLIKILNLEGRSFPFYLEKTGNKYLTNVKDIMRGIPAQKSDPPFYILGCSLKIPSTDSLVDYGIYNLKIKIFTLTSDQVRAAIHHESIIHPRWLHILRMLRDSSSSLRQRNNSTYQCPWIFYLFLPLSK